LPFRRSGGLSTPDDRPNSEFTLYYSIKEGKIIAVGGQRLNPYPYEYEPENVLMLDTNNEIIVLESDVFENNDDVISIMPIDTNGNRRVWRWSDRKKILFAAKRGDFVVNTESLTVTLKDRIKSGRNPKTECND